MIYFIKDIAEEAESAEVECLVHTKCTTPFLGLGLGGLIIHRYFPMPLFTRFTAFDRPSRAV